jgi:hypothetical protein
MVDKGVDIVYGEVEGSILRQIIQRGNVDQPWAPENSTV